MIVASDDMRIVRSASAIDLRRIAPYLAGAAVFVLFSTPSIKLYLYTEAINAVPLVLFAGSLLMNPPGRVSRARLSGLMLGMMLFAVLFFFGAGRYASALSNPCKRSTTGIFRKTTIAIGASVGASTASVESVRVVRNRAIARAGIAGWLFAVA